MSSKVCRTLLQRFIASKLTQACSTRSLLLSSCNSDIGASFLRSLHSTRKIPILTFSTHAENKQVVELSQQEGYEELDILYQKILVEVTSHDPAVLKSYEYFATEAAKLLDIQAYSYQPPKIIERTTVLKSRHVYGKYHKVQYERRTHFKVIVLEKLTGSTADTYLEYIQRNLPEGVGMKVTKEQLEKFPVHIKKPE